MTETKSLKSKIHDLILEGIIQAEYHPEQILNEKQLTEKYQISKSPVREALIELCNEGVLRNLPRYGYEVIRLTRSDVEDILEFRLILESGCLRRCCSSLHERQIQSLKDLNTKCNLQTEQSNLWEHWEHNKQFHLKLASFACNPYIYEQLRKSMDTLTRAYAQFYWDKWNPGCVRIDVRSHAHLITALEQSDVEEALRYLELDLKDFGI